LRVEAARLRGLGWRGAWQQAPPKEPPPKVKYVVQLDDDEMSELELRGILIARDAEVRRVFVSPLAVRPTVFSHCVSLSLSLTMAPTVWPTLLQEARSAALSDAQRVAERHKRDVSAWRGGQGEEHYRSSLRVATQQLARRMDGDTWNLSHCRLSDSEMCSITVLLVDNPQLVKLDLSHNSLRDRSVTMLVEQLRKTTNLRRLSLAGNPIGELPLSRRFSRPASLVRVGG
jgi:hypothetical protein